MTSIVLCQTVTIPISRTKVRKQTMVEYSLPSMNAVHFKVHKESDVKSELFWCGFSSRKIKQM